MISIISIMIFGCVIAIVLLIFRLIEAQEFKMDETGINKNREEALKEYGNKVSLFLKSACRVNILSGELTPLAWVNIEKLWKN